MQNLANQSSPETIQITLDGQSIALPQECKRSLRDIFSYLEQLAVQQDRILASVSVDGTTVAAPCLQSPSQTFQQIEANSISLNDLGSHVLLVARDQVQQLLSRVEAIQMLVLINDWPVAQQLWCDLVPDFKTPMLELSFLQELWGERLSATKIGDKSLAQHWDQIGRIQAEVELVLTRRQDILDFSDILEKRLLPWLKLLLSFLNQLQDSACSPT